MKLINLFLVIIILYVTYKIIIYNEHFNNKINLSNKNIYGKNVFYGVDPDDLESYNKLDHLDLSKHNLIIDNTGENNKFKINDKLCFGNNCINKEKIELISGELDAPKFYKDDKAIYYNHDCNKSKNKNSECKIKDVDDLPNKMCFVNGDKEQCLNYTDLEVLDGERAMKISNNKIKSEVYEGYVKEPYIYKNEIECNSINRPNNNDKKWRKKGNKVYKKKCKGNYLMNKCKQECMNQQITECKESYSKSSESNFHGNLGDTQKEKSDEINVQCADLTGSIKYPVDKQKYIYNKDRYCMSTRKKLANGYSNNLVDESELKDLDDQETKNILKEAVENECNENNRCTSFTYDESTYEYKLHDSDPIKLKTAKKNGKQCAIGYKPSNNKKKYIKYDNKYCNTSKNIGIWTVGNEDDAKNACDSHPNCKSFTCKKEKIDNGECTEYELHNADPNNLTYMARKDRICFNSYNPVDRKNTYIGYGDNPTNQYECRGKEIGSAINYTSTSEYNKLDEAIQMCDSVDNCDSITVNNDNYNIHRKHIGLENTFKKIYPDVNPLKPNISKCYKISNDTITSINGDISTNGELKENVTIPVNSDKTFYKKNENQKCSIVNNSSGWKNGELNDAKNDCNNNFVPENKTNKDTYPCNSFTFDKKNKSYKLHSADKIPLPAIKKSKSVDNECYEKIDDVKISTPLPHVPTTSSIKTPKQAINDNYIMPYYIDFKKTERGIGGSKDQLLYKTANHCSQSNGINSYVPKCDDCMMEAEHAFITYQRDKLKRARKIRDYALAVTIPAIWAAAAVYASTGAAYVAAAGPLAMGVAAGLIYLKCSIAAALITTAVVLGAKTADWAYLDNISNNKLAIRRKNKWILDWINNLSYFSKRKYPYYDNINTEYRASSICRNIKDKSSDVDYKGIPTKCYDILKPGTVSNEGRMCPHTCKLNRKDMFNLKKSSKNIEIIKKFQSQACKLDFSPGVKCITTNAKMDETKKHGFYILPYKEKTDKNYTGYFIDKDNYNITNRINKNAINMAAISRGTFDDHRASHNGKCGVKSTKLASDLFFCTGFGLKNNFKTKHDYRCNPIIYYDKKLKEQEECEKRIRSENTFIKDSEQKEPDFTECKIDELDTTDDSNELSVSTEYNVNSIPETNYFIKPALNTDGNLIKSNTYFHGHEHVHMKDIDK